MDDFSDDRGSTLLMVVWIFAIMGLIAAFLVYRSELEWAAVINTERGLAARNLAGDVLRERVKLFEKDKTEIDTFTDSWVGENGRIQFDRDGFQITVIVEDEGSKFNLNLLSEEESKLILEKSSKIDALLDWIDRDGELRSEGAEIDYYQSLSPAYKPRDGFLSSLRELLAVRDGKELYEALSPCCTVYGKYNLNILSGEKLENLLCSAGFDENWAEGVADAFVEFRKTQRFRQLEDLMQLTPVTLSNIEKLKQFLSIDGCCNINLVGKTALKLFLYKVGLDPELADSKADAIIKRRLEEPFTAIEEISPFFNKLNASVELEDYFSTVTKIVRYRIWLIKGQRRYYLETVQRRISSDKSKWRAYPLSWYFVDNRAVPEIPAVEERKDDEEVIDNG